MQVEDLKNLVKDIRRLRTETQTVELKAAAHNCPTRLFDTLSAFSNQDQGGIILFGVDEKSGYAVTGVYDAQDLQAKVTEQCKQMEPVVRVLFTVCEVEGKTVVAAEVPSVDPFMRPVFYRGTGRIRGSYVRVGDADEPMSEYEVYSYEAMRRNIHDDLRIVENVRIDLQDEALRTRYLAAVKAERPQLAGHVSDADIFELMGLTVQGKPTLAGHMVFSRYPQAQFPQLSITAVVLPGMQMGETGAEGVRFLDNRRITGSIPEMLETAVDFVMRNGRTATVIDDGGRRADRTEYPIRAVREAILNALVHRDYSVHTESIPIRIEMYCDRLEIANSGGLYGRMTVDQLGRIHPETRNQELADVLELLKITENRYSGIPTMRVEMEKAGLPAPVFVNERGEFKVVLRNREALAGQSPEERILEHCAVPRSREEIVALIGKSANYVTSKYIRPLVLSGRLELSLPDKPRSVRQRYRRAR